MELLNEPLKDHSASTYAARVGVPISGKNC